ncbi:prepilin-type N-terminal cleavage/methylation domain-containing protein [Pseudanabaena mucicola]|uniref:Type II secretion system protein n=1 Tax=Pseudanabaena mucicola FACHB-723 TaxID=2692860 RepID=A0ABR7ZY63_9CYAN|nr:prepilin-type N-terminal cleavage/methylation domain-containing protein [Pseudanabaena mucicola]MBD2188951.1 type II secretion system protein [Pseudanabaena mucicola FACHB-723]
MKSPFCKIVKFWQRAILRSPKRSNIKGNRHKRLAFGFTLIELLVAALIASLLVSVLLGFLLGVLDSDRKETAKSNAQEELQAAISYISDDLQEAIYIYGADALASINSQLPHTQTTDPSGDCNPTTNTCTPVLVFWKRYNYNPNAEANYTAPTAPTTKQYIGCMPYEDSNPASVLTACRASETKFGRDTYTYSLVAYYLKNDTNLGGSVWSNTARILRWELKDGYVAYCAAGGAITKSTTGLPVSPAGCPAVAKLSTRANSTLLPITSQVDSNVYFIAPDKGFARPDFSSAGTLSSLAAGWRKYDDFSFSTNPFVTLVDFMDDTAYNVNQGGDNLASAASSATTDSAIKIPIGKNVSIAGLPSTNPNCDDPSVGVGNTNPATTTNPSGTVTQRVPADFSDATSNPARLTSFYACVAPENVTVRLFMRGNAIARLATPAVDRTARQPTTNNLSFFPTADVRAFGRSAVGLKTR